MVTAAVHSTKLAISLCTINESQGALKYYSKIIKMASTDFLQLNEKMAKLQQYGIGYRTMNDPFFEANNTVIFKPFVRLGIYRYDDENLCHKS